MRQREIARRRLASKRRVSTAQDGDQALDYLENNQWPDLRPLGTCECPNAIGVFHVRRYGDHAREFADPRHQRNLPPRSRIGSVP